MTRAANWLKNLFPFNAQAHRNRVFAGNAPLNVGGTRSFASTHNQLMYGCFFNKLGCEPYSGIISPP